MSNIFLQQWAIWHHILSYLNLWGSGAPVLTKPLLFRTPLEDQWLQPKWFSVLSWRANVGAGECWNLSIKSSSIFNLY